MSPKFLLRSGRSNIEVRSISFRYSSFALSEGCSNEIKQCLVELEELETQKRVTFGVFPWQDLALSSLLQGFAHLFLGRRQMGS